MWYKSQYIYIYIYIKRKGRKEGKERKREDLTLPNCEIETSLLTEAETRNYAPCYRGQRCKVPFRFDEEVVLLVAFVLVACILKGFTARHSPSPRIALMNLDG
ncbi:hypothetical protein BDW60DRAFT_52186 [Aspergillus nidulans var. acristatus]